MKNFIASVCVLLLSLPCAADLFTATDDSLSIDMPAGWTRIANPPARSVLSAQKGDARLDIKTIDCTTESCIDRMMNNDVAEVKARQMTVVKNTYTDEEIKRTELATGEPFYYISFYSAKNDFSAGYFLIDGKGYSVLAKNITYADTDLLFAAISPLKMQQTAEEAPLTQWEQIDVFNSYDTQAMPDVAVENLQEPTPQTQPQQKAAAPSRWKKFFSRTLVRPQMSPLVRQLGHGYDVLMMLLTLFVLAWIASGVIRVFVPAKQVDLNANPNALYPIKLKRLYGTPSIIFRAKDNQGNTLTALAARWEALIMFTGIVMMLIALYVMAATSVCEQLKVAVLNPYYNALYAGAGLVLPLGLVVFFCGVVWDQVALSEVTLFDRNGKKAAVLLQKGYSLAREQYQIYFANSKELMLAERKRFTLRRTWKLLSKDRIEFATITERSAGRAVARMLCGHLWGMLRADYDIVGAMESRGVIENKHALFNQSVCNMDKPEAVQARDLLAISLLISIRDRDKWYPWFN